MNRYLVTFCKILDGDTVDLIIDLGFSISVRQKFRLNGIDTPELSGESATAALRSKERLAELCGIGPLFVETIKTAAGEKREKYGRYLARLFLLGQEKSFNEILIEEGHAKSYDGGKR